MDYDALKVALDLSASEGMNEKNDCAVRAVAIITGKSYTEIHQVFARCGRRHRGRTWHHTTTLVLMHLGIKTVPVLFKGKTIRTLARELPKGYYLVRIRNHMLAIKDGRVCDWTEGRLHRVKEVYKVL